MEIALHDKEKQIKAEQFYLKKQWEELEDSKKKKKEVPQDPSKKMKS